MLWDVFYKLIQYYMKDSGRGKPDMFKILIIYAVTENFKLKNKFYLDYL